MIYYCTYYYYYYDYHYYNIYIYIFSLGRVYSVARYSVAGSSDAPEARQRSGRARGSWSSRAPGSRGSQSAWLAQLRELRITLMIPLNQAQ